MVMHAALISVPNSRDGVVIIGSSGAGKSTVANAASQAGWQVYGDDLIAVRTEHGRLVGFGLRDFLRLRLKSSLQIIPVKSISEVSIIREIWTLKLCSTRPKRSMLKPVGTRDCLFDIFDSFSYGYALSSRDALTETIRMILSVRMRPFLSGVDMVQSPHEAMTSILQASTLEPA
jgi:hypothetical protein